MARKPLGIREIKQDAWQEAAKAAHGRITHIYVIQELSTGPCKIGISRNAFWRMQSLQTGNHRSLHLRCVFEADIRSTALKMESAVLAYFSEHIISGEWLDVDPDDIANFLRRG